MRLYIAKTYMDDWFLSGEKEPWFDKDKSVLHFMGETINIRLKGEKPNDHYILEAIFDNEDKTEEVYFKDIAKKYLGME